MAANPVKLFDIFEEAQSLVSKHAILLGISVFAITALYSAFDWLLLANPGQNGFSLLSTISGFVISLFMQYRVTEQLLADRRNLGSQLATRRYGSLFGALFLSSLAIGAGLIAFIIPGLYLAGRWLTVTARVVESNLGGNAALGASWVDSETSQLPFSLAYLVSLTPLALLAGLAFGGWEALFDSSDLLSILVVNLMTGLAFVLGWTIATAAYRCAVPSDKGIDQVFA